MADFTAYSGTEQLKGNMLGMRNEEFAIKFPGLYARKFDGYSRMVAYNEKGEIRPVTRMVRFFKTSKPHKCGARCRQAKGGDCECECGGKFHGAGMDAK